MITAKVTLQSKHESGTGTERQVVAAFTANHGSGVNAEWARYTPSLSLSMSLKGDVADKFVIGQAYTLTFEEDNG
jgi:hypothetical protein